MLKLQCLLFLFVFIAAHANAQRKLFSGIVRDSITLFPVPKASVTNATANKSVIANETGFFRLEAAPNDFIYASAKNYHHDTLHYSLIFTDTVTILLSPSGNILPEVVVTTRHTRYQLDSMERWQAFRQLRGTDMRTVSSAPPGGFGIAINLDRIFKKKYRARNRKQEIFKDTEKTAYINYRYSPHLVAYFTGLKGDALQEFMNRYTPDYTWLRQHLTNEDVMYYINENLKAYKAKR